MKRISVLFQMLWDLPIQYFLIDEPDISTFLYANKWNKKIREGREEITGKKWPKTNKLYENAKPTNLKVSMILCQEILRKLHQCTS